MRKPINLLLMMLACFLVAGCGGQLGHDSPTQIRMESSVGTIAFGNIHLVLSPLSGSSTSPDGVWSGHPQSWADEITTASSEEIDFTTNSNQVPYFLYVENTSAVQEKARVRIFMDGSLKFDQVVTVPATSAVQIETIFRNNVQNP